MFKEFKEFAMRGNVVDMATGIIIGGAFGTIVKSLVDDVIMPPIGLLLGKVDFNSLFVSLNGKVYPSLDAAKKAGAPTLNYGAFINTVLDFIIVAFAMFLLVQWFETVSNRMQPPAAPEPPKTTNCPYCLSAIPIGAKRCPNCTSQLEQQAA